MRWQAIFECIINMGSVSIDSKQLDVSEIQCQNIKLADRKWKKIQEKIKELIEKWIKD